MQKFFITLFFAVVLFSVVAEEPVQSVQQAEPPVPVETTKIRQLEDIFPPDVCEILRKEGRIQRSLFKQKALDYVYLPSGNLNESIRNFWTDEKCSYINETVFLFSKPDSGTGGQNSPENTVEILENILKSVSKLEGITYFSNSRQAERLLYKRVFCVSDAETRTPVPDPVDKDINGLSVLVLQEDLTFGENLYRFSYLKDGNQIALFYENETPMELMFLDVIDPNQMKNVLLVEDLGDEILFYGLVRTNYISFPGLKNRINASLSSRLDAMYKWFVSAYEDKVN